MPVRVTGHRRYGSQPAPGRVAPRLSIGLPVLNGERTLEAAIRGLLAQSFEDFELLISDNASTDATESIGRAHAAADRRIRYERNPTNIGLAGNFNRVFLRTRGELFKWASADDVCLPEFLARCVAELDAHPDVVLAYARTRFIDAADRPLPLSDPGYHLPHESAAERFRIVMTSEHWLNAFSGVLRRRSLARTHLMPIYDGGDNVLLGELALLGKVVEVPEVLYHRRLHEGALSQHHGDATWRTRYWGSGVLQRLPKWRRYGGDLRSIVRAELGLGEKLMLCGRLLRDAGWARQRLWQELRDALAAQRLPDAAEPPTPVRETSR